MQGWDLADVLQEYYSSASEKRRSEDIDFIHSFDVAQYRRYEQDELNGGESADTEEVNVITSSTKDILDEDED